LKHEINLSNNLSNKKGELVMRQATLAIQTSKSSKEQQFRAKKQQVTLIARWLSDEHDKLYCKWDVAQD
jgi:hypothetical protein